VPGDIIADVDLRRTIDMAIDQVTERLAEAVRAQTLFVQGVWISAVSGNLLPGMSRPVQDELYAATISDAASLQYPFDGDPFHGRVLAVDGSLALRHERGFPTFDMKCIANKRARVLTDQGWRRIDSIEAGDFVLSHDGAFHRVARAWKEPLGLGAETLAISTVRAPRDLIVTPNHPMLRNGEWVAADALRPGDRVACLGRACKGCGGTARWLNDYCSRSCKTASLNRAHAVEGSHPMQSDRNRTRQARWASDLVARLVTEGRHLSTNPAIAAKVAATVTAKLEAGTHPFQREDNQTLAAEALGKVSRGFNKPEMALAGALTSLGLPGLVRQFRWARPVATKLGGPRYYFFDFAFPEHRIAVEVNGARWHTDEQDRTKKAEVEGEEWRYLSLPALDVLRHPGDAADRVAAHVANHEGGWRMAETVVTRVARRVVGKHSCEQHRFNLTVEDTGTFVVEGLIVHNSGLLRGPNSRVAKDGKSRYNTVPFGHSAPGRGAVGQKGAVMPQDIYALAKRLPHGGRLKLPGELSGWGTRSKVPAGVNAEWNRRQSFIGRFLRTPPMTAPYTHKTGHYEGMVRTGRKGHTSYMTFRRVSSNSSPNSWIHPGREPNPILAAVRAYCEPLVVAALEQAARDLDASGGLS